MFRPFFTEGVGAEREVQMQEFDTEVRIVDAVMGAGKSSAAINYMNANKGEERFLYITPFLDEIERVRENCPELDFHSPSDEKCSKLKDIKELLSKGCNIASTHALFSKFDAEVVDMCRCRNYTLVMDEVADVLSIIDLTPADTKILLENFVDVAEDGILVWRESEKNYVGKFSYIKKKCEMNSLAIYGDKVVLWLLPIAAFNAFRKVYILTYLFKGQVQRYYYDYYGLPYRYSYVAGDNVSNYTFTDEPTSQPVKYNYAELINVLENSKLNDIGSRKSDLSKSWFTRNTRNDVVLNQLRNNIENYFKNICKSKTSKNLWTTYKDFRKIISGKGYGKGFLPCNARATNLYKDRDCVAYCLNVYLNPCIKNFFTVRGIAVDEDTYAVSEMLQFVWRSAIRDGKPINVYVPSIRMRELFVNWIKDNS